MKHNAEQSKNTKAIIGVILTALFIFLLVWFVQSLPISNEDNGPTVEEAARYEEYKSEQLLNENDEQEACMDKMATDVERYGEQIIDTYDCSR